MSISYSLDYPFSVFSLSFLIPPFCFHGPGDLRVFPWQQGRFRGDADVLRLLSLEIGQYKLVCLSLDLALSHRRQGMRLLVLKKEQYY